jgi:hypothetical protein
MDPPWWACSRGCNQDIVDEYRTWTAAESQREMAEHAKRVHEQKQHVDAEIAEILGPDPDAEQFAGRMSMSAVGHRRRRSRCYATRSRR